MRATLNRTQRIIAVAIVAISGLATYALGLWAIYAMGMMYLKWRGLA